MTSTPAHRPRIAVIAVHGVADQKPSETVRTAANMLARATESAQQIAVPEQNRAPTGLYSPFEEHSLRIPVTRVPTPGRGESGRRSRLRQAFAYKVQSQAVHARLSANSAARNGDMSLAYMTELLQPYEVSGEDSIYETLRIASTRAGSTADADVDVYEMYWADLSRFVGNWMRWLIEFYQLLFDLCILGRKSLGFARAQCQPPARSARDPRWIAWPVFSQSQITAERSLALFVPVLNLHLLAIALSLLPLLIPRELIALAVEGLIAIAAALASALVIYFRRTWLSSSGRGWPWALLVPLLMLAAGGSLEFTGLVADAPYLWLMLTWWPLPLITLLWAMSAYQKTRRGALPTTVFVGIPVTAIYVYLILEGHANAAEILTALLHTSEWILLALLGAWVSLYLSALVMTLSGAIAPLSVPKGEQRDAAWRAAWTANLTVVLPGILVLILNLTLWQCLISLAAPPEANSITTAAPTADASSLLAEVKTSSLWHTPYQPCWGNSTCLKLLYPAGTHPDTVANLVHALLKQSQTPLYCIGLLLFILAAGLVVWTIIPAAVAELQARHTSPAKSPAERHSASDWLGESLSAGFRAMRLSGEIVRLEFIALIPIGGLLFWLVQAHLTKIQAVLENLNSLSLFVAGWLVLALIASQGPFRVLALGLRSALDISLDVINWLRIDPQQSNCRARICARFYSLLKHLEEWRSREDGQGYQAIVILSHSQGTVIAADLLRYLNSQDLAPDLPIYLFTMGCPLRQLYGLRFPHLYGWARKDGEKWPCGPQPDEIGVALWVNAYTSGDYVGRYLWYPDVIRPADGRWSVYPTGPTGDRRREFCVGAGAHTHYWDDSAPEIAIELDQLIGLASRSPAPANRPPGTTALP